MFNLIDSSIAYLEKRESIKFGNKVISAACLNILLYGLLIDLM